MIKLLNIRIVGVVVGIMGVVLTRLAAWSPEIVEHYYSRTFFPVIRSVFDWINGIIPIPLFYVTIPSLLVGMWLYVGFFTKAMQSVSGKLTATLLSLLSYLGFVLFIFQLSWGFNYKRIPLEKQLGLELQAIDSSRLTYLFELSSHQVDSLRRVIAKDTKDSVRWFVAIEDIEKEMNRAVRKFMEELGLPGFDRLKVRQLKPEGILLRFRTAGFYLPFTGESNIDAGLHTLQMPFVIAHEFGHAIGFGDEGACNLIGFICCIQSDEPMIQYAGWLQLWAEILRNYAGNYPEVFDAMFSSLPDGPLADLQDIRRQMALYPDMIPQWRNFAYKWYLHSQGVKEGLQSYNRLLSLADGWIRVRDKK